METARMLRLGGAITALVTPLRRDGLDRPALRALVEWQILSGVDGLTVCSTTGEGRRFRRRSAER
jgi:4-hydroxy-tetrahydrodipicolinate synthase